MNKPELVDFIANRNNINKVEAEKVINYFISGVMDAVSEGNDISLLGFGSFTVNAIDAREGMNPKTKEPLQSKAYNQVRFKVGQRLKDAANKSNSSREGKKESKADKVSKYEDKSDKKNVKNVSKTENNKAKK